MSLNTKKQRQFLYRYTFLKWTPEQRLSTFEKSAIELSLAIHNFGNKPTDKTMNMLAEKIGDLETMAEVSELSFENLRQTIDVIKKEKLTTLQKQSRLIETAESLEAKAEEKRVLVSEYAKKKYKPQGFWQWLWFHTFR